MPMNIRAGVRHRLFDPLLRLGGWIVRMGVREHTECSECAYRAHALARRFVLVRQLFAEHARWTADMDLGCVDLISWGQPHGHMAFILPCARTGEHKSKENNCQSTARSRQLVRYHRSGGTSLTV